MMSVFKKDHESGVGKNDPLCHAVGATALVLALNKPIYPIYVWFLAESAFQISFLTALTMPFYLAIWYLARRGRSFAARLGMVVAGLADTLAIAFILGQESNTLAFMFACLMLSGVAFYRSEVWLSRSMIAVVFVLFVVLEGRMGGPIMDVSAADMENLAYLNITGAAAIAAFIMLRFPRPEGLLTPPASSDETVRHQSGRH